MNPTNEPGHVGIEYPLVRCDRHAGAPRLGYAICMCIARGEGTVKEIEYATADTLGYILCGCCVRRAEQGHTLSAEDFRLVCEACAREQGLLLIGAKIREVLP